LYGKTYLYNTSEWHQVKPQSDGGKSLLIDIVRRQSRGSNSLIENFFLHRKRDPFLNFSFALVLGVAELQYPDGKIACVRFPSPQNAMKRVWFIVSSMLAFSFGFLAGPLRAQFVYVTAPSRVIAWIARPVP
jgi:hypothetical protein